jgi:VCBS repeat-containing protein
LTATLASGPSHGTAQLAANGSFTYTPAPNFTGTDSFTYRASDGAVESAPATVTITVTPVNDPPAAITDTATVAEDTTLTVAAPGVLSNDVDPDGDLLTAVLATDTTSGTLTLAPDGSYTYTPQPNFTGTDVFTYRIDDGVTLSDPVTVTITVTPVNDAPVPADDAYPAQQGQQLVVTAPGVLDNDTDAEDTPLTAALVSGPTHGALQLAGNGSFTYTAVAGYTGTDSFTYRASDGTTSSAPATVVITIRGPQPQNGWSVTDATPVPEPRGSSKGDAVFTVSLAAPATTTVSVRAATRDGTAKAGKDYTAVTVDLTFRRGELTKTVRVPILTDHIQEGQEGFSLILSKPTGVPILRGTGAATILADPPLPTLSATDAAPVREPQPRTRGVAEFVITLSTPSRSPVLVHVATRNGTARAGKDYTAISLDLRFQPGQTRKTVRVRILADRVTEGQEQFSLVLSKPVDAVITRDTATCTILGP